MFNIDKLIKYLPAIAFAAALFLRSKEISADLKGTRESSWFGTRLADVKDGEFFRFKGRKETYQKVGVNPLIGSVFNPFLTHLAPVIAINSGVLHFESGDVRVRKVR